MRRYLKISLMVCVIAGILALSDNLHAAVITVLSPANNSYVESEQLNLVVLAPKGDAGTLQVFAGGNIYTKTALQSTGVHPVCLSVKLMNGQNTIDLLFTGRSGVVSKNRLNVYLRSGLLKPYQNPPAGYQRYYFHLPGNEEACVACHRMEAHLQDLNPVRPEDSPCYVCHRHKSGGTYKHRPAAEGNCFSCHEVSAGRRKYDTRKPDKRICFVCHSAQDKLWKSKRVHHGPTAVGTCTLCHNPHSSDWPSFVHIHPTDLCLNCHQDKKSGLHVIAGFFGKGHPVRAASDPLRRDRPFSCAGCHNPHAGDTQNLLNSDRSNQARYCQTCHKL